PVEPRVTLGRIVIGNVQDHRFPANSPPITHTELLLFEFGKINAVRDHSAVSDSMSVAERLFVEDFGEADHVIVLAEDFRHSTEVRLPLRVVDGRHAMRHIDPTSLQGGYMVEQCIEWPGLAGVVDDHVPIALQHEIDIVANGSAHPAAPLALYWETMDCDAVDVRGRAQTTRGGPCRDMDLMPARHEAL